MTAKSSPLSLTRRRLLGGAAALAGASMFAPHLGSAQTPEGATPAANVTPGGTLKATLGAEPDTLDPHKGNTLFDRDVWDQLYDALVDDDILSGVRGALAESWDSPDATAWTFKLRQGLTFHDGSPVTSAEVKWSVERVQNPDTGASGALGRIVTHVKTIDTPDANTIVFTLDAPNAAFPMQMADIKILPQNFDETKPVGAGPFTFGEWVRNQHVLVNKFANYYRQGEPYLDAIEFRPTPDEDQKVVLLQTNQVDFTDTIPLPRAQEVQKGGQLQVFTIPEGVSPSSYFMPVNCRKPPLDDPRVRQAMNFAIDRQALLDATFGFGTIKSNVVPPKHWAFNPDALSFNKRDVDQAKKLLADAGQSGGFDIELKHITSRAEYTTIAQIVQANLADVGINVKILPEEIGVWVDEVLNKHDFQWGLTGIIPAYDPDYMMSRYDINDADGASMGWENDEYQQLLVQGRAAVEQEERKKIYFRAQEIAQEAAPGFIINERPILYGASMAVQGFRPDIRQHTHFTTVWLKK
ncbi:MAG TPA: ABC transporter substrate-binding protein [Thermomicrobiales bacterium]|nr:ABC transporter substrate-binding protein [Thermomicrobiales bacterium]